MHNLEVFTAKVYSKITGKEGNNLAELSWNMYLKDLKEKGIKNESANVKNRTQKSVFEKLPPTYEAFHQHVNRAHLQSLIFNKADKAVIEMKKSRTFRMEV